MLTRVAWQLCVDDAFLVSKPRTVWEFVRTRTLESVSPYTNTSFGAESWVASWENSTSWTPKILPEFWGSPAPWFGGVVNTVLRRVVNHSTLAIAKQFVPLIDPFGPVREVRGL